jgi:phosphoglycerate dehydrogenase-like enzyme
MPKKLLHLASRELRHDLFIDPFIKALQEIGELEIVTNAEDLLESKLADKIRNCQILLTGWDSANVPASIAESPGSLEYICHVTGSVRGFIPIEVIKSAIPVTNWGPGQAYYVAEATLALLLACLKNLRKHIEIKRNGQWKLPHIEINGSLRNSKIGIFGFGIIARQFYDFCRPFGANITIFDPFVSECEPARVDSLEELFDTCDTIIVMAGLNEDTRHSINAELLAKLPDNGIIINTARGAIIDQEALLKELESGRLRAGLDVLDGDDELGVDHPARNYQNLILTAHQCCLSDWPPNAERLHPMHDVCLDNIGRHLNGEPLRYEMDEPRFELST